VVTDLGEKNQSVLIQQKNEYAAIDKKIDGVEKVHSNMFERMGLFEHPFESV